jgi:hypothetical protein
MKALTKNGIDESTIEIGTLVNWQAKDSTQIGDVVSYIDRDADGTITRIAFGSWLHIFTDRMKLHVKLFKSAYGSGLGTGMYKNELSQVGYWYKKMQVRGLITVN